MLTTVLALISMRGGGTPDWESVGKGVQTMMTSKSAESLASLDNALINFKTENRLKGIEFMVIKSGRIVYGRAIGWAYTNQDSKLDLKTQVPIGSITKSLTAMTVMHLVQVGRIKLDAPFMDYLKDRLTGISVADDRWRSVTVRELLQMTAGIPDELSAMWRFLHKDNTSSDFYAKLLGAKLAHDPGSAQSYNNDDFAILGDVIDSVMGRHWYEVAQDDILTPYGVGKLGTWKNTPHEDNFWYPWDSGAGGVGCLSLLQLGRLVQQFADSPGSEPLSWDTRREMLQPPPTPLYRNSDGSVQGGYYGLGLMDVHITSDGAAFAHGGSVTNAKTIFQRWSDDTILVGFYSGEMPTDHDGSGEWKMLQRLTPVVQSIDGWPAGVRF